MTTVNLKEARELIRTCGTTNTFICQGEPGAGKSAMLQTLAEQTALEPRYIDCALLDLGDLQMPRVGDAVEFVPNQMFVGNKPLIVMLDEIGTTNMVTDGLGDMMNGLRGAWPMALMPRS